MESICIQDQDDFIDHTATRHSKSSRSKKKNKPSQAETKKSDKPWMDAYQDQEHDSSVDITIANGKRHRRRQHKKIKRKTSSVSSSSSSASSSTTVTPNVTPSSAHSGTIHLTTYNNNNNNNNKVRHCDYYEDFPLDEDFPALLSPFTIKSTANPHHPMTLPPHVLALNSISTNFAQIVARNKMKK
jgi:hypothetical protein